jgi:hypothetical protein
MSLLAQNLVVWIPSKARKSRLMTHNAENYQPRPSRKLKPETARGHESDARKSGSSFVKSNYFYAEPFLDRVLP